jgi:WhiB family transcriptional regulator, redox-sensing transcriptional regulator
MSRPKQAQTLNREKLFAAIERIMREAAARLGTQLPDWHSRAACAGTDPEIFYPGAPPDESLIKVAKLICNGDPEIGRPECPVKLECLADAMRNHDRHGIWGGMTYNERNQVRKAGYNLKARRRER